MFGLMCVCVCMRHTQAHTHAAQLKLKAEAVHQVRFGSWFLVSSHGHNQEPLTPSLLLSPPLTPSPTLLNVCVCVSCVWFSARGVDVGWPVWTDVDCAVKWGTGHRRGGRSLWGWATGKAAAASINFRFAFQSTAKRVNLTDSSADTRHQVSASIGDDQTSPYASICLRCVFREFFPAYLHLSRRRLVNLIYTISSLSALP